jgi:hypothetical protein
VFRKIRHLGLQSIYSDRENSVGIWLKSFFGLPFLDPLDVADSFVTDIMSDADPSVEAFADYMLQTYIASDAQFPPNLWAAVSNSDMFSRTTNAAESFQVLSRKDYVTKY